MYTIIETNVHRTTQFGLEINPAPASTTHFSHIPVNLRFFGCQAVKPRIGAINN